MQACMKVGLRAETQSITVAKSTHLGVLSSSDLLDALKKTLELK
jgi:hypothetical protein